MEEDQEVKHACKLCSKAFPCGRSLGGHMRSHVISTNLPPSGYGLRENPRKTWRIADPLATGKLCRECGRAFHSWKALFGHIKCHSASHKDQDSWSNKLLLDSQSDNEAAAAAAPSKRRRTRRYRIASSSAASSAVSSFANPHSSSTASISEAEHEHEQEEVAMSLMMLSRDASPWTSAFHSESSDSHCCWGFANLKGSESELDYLSALGESEAVNVKSRLNDGTEPGSSKHTSTKARLSDSLGKKTHKRGKFECTTCNKIFHSYQALGGHRASHKKAKGCFSARNEINSIQENDLSPDPKTTGSSKLVKHHESELPLPLDDAAAFDNESYCTPKKEKVHQCPICQRVFSSGQALGGHKRSHMAAGSDARNSHTIVLPEPAPEPEIRELLDLNIPAAAAAAAAAADATEEEESNSINADSNRPWWVLQGSHKEEAMVGLMS